MKTVIQKFGGTSVASADGRACVIDKIRQALQNGLMPVVVVSAMGRKGSPYATDTLLGLVTQAGRAEMKRNLDLLLSCGEVISAVVLADELIAHGLSATVLTGGQAGIITDERHNDAQIIDLRPDNLRARLEDGQIVVVSGFQGVSEKGEITTLGRGGSDTTAACLALALDACAIEIYTDVEGIMTADPRIVSDAQILESITYHDLCRLTQAGAKVVHPQAAEIAMRKQIPMWVRSTFSDHCGTLVTDQERAGKRQKCDIIGIAYLDNRTWLTIDDKAYNPMQQQVRKILAEADINIEFCGDGAFLIKDEDSWQARQLLENNQILCNIEKNCSKVSVISAHYSLDGDDQIAQMRQSLLAEKITFIHAAASDGTIWCLVKNDEKKRAVQILHHTFHLN